MNKILQSVTAFLLLIIIVCPAYSQNWGMLLNDEVRRMAYDSSDQADKTTARTYHSRGNLVNRLHADVNRGVSESGQFFVTTSVYTGAAEYDPSYNYPPTTDFNVQVLRHYDDSSSYLVLNRTQNRASLANCMLAPKSLYTMVFQKPGYYSSIIQISTNDVGEFACITGRDLQVDTNGTLAILQTAGDILLSVVMRPIEDIVMDSVYYEFDKWNLTRTSQKALDKYVELINKNPNLRHIELAAHTDNRGSDAYNQTLSEKRAESVRKYFMSKGIDADRLVSCGYGERYPVVANARTEGEHALNRRTAMVIPPEGYQFLPIKDYLTACYGDTEFHGYKCTSNQSPQPVEQRSTPVRAKSRFSKEPFGK